MKPPMNRHSNRVIRAPRGTALSAKSWLTEAPLRMLMNNLDPEVAEHPEELVVYGGIGRAARNWECYDRIVATLRELGDEETLLIQSGKPVGVFRTHARRATRADRELEPRAPLGHLGALQRARPQGPDDVRPDDGRAPGSTSAARGSSRAPTRPLRRWRASISAARRRASGS